ncbi:MAG: aquaporin [Bacteroidota bacterium]
MQKYVVEFIGTFFLILFIGGTLLGNAGEMAPIGIGLGLVGLIYAGGHISAAHYNPAVTLAAYLYGVCPKKDVVPYLLAQFAAALLAFGCVDIMFEKAVVAKDFAAAPPVLLAELLGTFILVYVILNVAAAKGTKNNSFYGVAIGFTVVGLAYTLGDVSGGVFNPAVAVAAALMGLLQLADLWMHFIAEIMGALLAVFTFRYTERS